MPILIGTLGLVLRVIVAAQRNGIYTSGESFMLPFDWLLGFPAAALLFVIAGALILQHAHAAHEIGRLCLWIGIGLMLADVLDGMGQLAAARVVAGWCAALSAIGIGLVLNLGIVVLLLKFPTGQFISPRWRWVAVVAAIGTLFSLLQSALRSELWLNNARGSVPNPLYIGSTSDVWRMGQIADGFSTLTISIILLTLLAAAMSIGVRWLRSDHTTRQQLQWLLLVMSITMMIFVAGWLAWQFFPHVDYFAGFLIGIVCLMLGTPIAIGIAILRHGLFDIDLIWNRALVYGALSLFIALAYALIVGSVGALANTQGNLALTVIAIGCVAAAFNPIRYTIQRNINRLMYGQRDEPYAMLANLSRQLEATLTPDLALQEMTSTINQSLKLPYVAVIASDTIIAHGTPPAGASFIDFPIRHQHEQLGVLRIAPRAGEALSGKDQQLLRDLSLQAGLALHSAQLNADLQRSRQRIVTAREEERRRLRRDLHDGLGPTLASQTLKLDAAIDLIEDDPTQAREMLAQLKRQTQTTVSDVRRLVYELRPPALDEQGLVGAIRNFASSINGLAVTVDAPDALPQMPAAVEVAAYRIVMEAITNVIKHTQAARCGVRLGVTSVSGVVGVKIQPTPATPTTPFALHIEISDDGTGIDLTHPSGVGLRSMRERAEELGGGLTIESKVGQGTTIAAEIPIPQGLSVGNPQSHRDFQSKIENG